MSKELDFLPWQTLLNNRIHYYNNLLESTEYYGDFKNYMIKLVEPFYKKLGWNENLDKDEWINRLILNKIKFIKYKKLIFNF